MLRRAFGTLRMRRAPVLTGSLLLFTATALAAPRITDVLNSAPPHGKQGEKVLFQVEGLVAPVQVFFSDGANPTVEAPSVQCDPVRGFLAAQVPVGVQTGNMKVTANGVDSPPHYFRADSGVYDPGSGTVQGTTTGPGGPVAGVLLALLRPNPCDGMDVIDSSVSSATGAYTLHGPQADVMILAFPPVVTALAGAAMPVTLGLTPATVDIPLSGGTTVNGRVVPASSPATGVGNARVDFEGDAGYETRLTDALGNFSVVLPPGNVKVKVAPTPTEALARDQQAATIGSTSPQTLPDIALGGGVRIHGFVRRASDGAPLPGVQLSAWAESTCCGNLDEKVSGGDGSFALVVPANQTYDMNTWMDQDAPFADASVSGIVVGASDVHQDVSIQDAGAITGTVLDASTGAPVAQLNVQAFAMPYNGSSVAYARTCRDGSYRLRVPPSAAGYAAGAGFYDSSSYVPIAWNNTPAGTLYSCEGAPISVPSASTVVAGIDLRVAPGAAAVSGSLLSQASACTTPVGGPSWVNVDDGGSHNCGLGWMDWNASPGTYRVLGLPGSDLVPGLRVCASGSLAGAPQCWNVKRPPAFDPVHVQPGAEASGIDFCLGDIPTRPVLGVRASKSGGSVTFTWIPTDDPYQGQYQLRGAVSARPASSPGSFPSDPTFDSVWSGPSPSATVSTSDFHRFFLVTNVGMGGAEGPCGSYAP